VSFGLRLALDGQVKDEAQPLRKRYAQTESAPRESELILVTIRWTCWVSWSN